MIMLINDDSSVLMISKEELTVRLQMAQSRTLPFRITSVISQAANLQIAQLAAK